MCYCWSIQRIKRRDRATTNTWRWTTREAPPPSAGCRFETMHVSSSWNNTCVVIFETIHVSLSSLAKPYFTHAILATAIHEAPLPACMPVCLCVSLSLSVSCFLSLFLFLYLSQSVCLSPSIYLSLSQSVCVSRSLCLSASVCLSLSVPVSLSSNIRQ